MALTVHTLGLLALGYNGIQSYDPAVVAPKRKFTVQDGIEVLAAINGGMQELFALNPKWITSRPYTFELHAPVTGTVTATNGSATISGGDSLFTAGKTIMLDGDEFQNELVNATTLLYPHGGTSGTIGYTLYGDAVVLPSGVNAIGEPAWLQDIRKLQSCSTFDELLSWDVQYHENYGMHMGNTRRRRSVQEPLAYYVEPFYNRTSFDSRLKLSPLPDRRYLVRATAIMGPPAYALADLYNPSTFADPGIVPAIPHDKHESVLLPHVLQRYSGSATYANEKARQEIARQFAMSGQILQRNRPNAAGSPPLIPNRK